MPAVGQQNLLNDVNIDCQTHSYLHAADASLTVSDDLRSRLPRWRRGGGKSWQPQGLHFDSAPGSRMAPRRRMAGWESSRMPGRAPAGAAPIRHRRVATIIGVTKRAAALWTSI